MRFLLLKGVVWCVNLEAVDNSKLIINDNLGIRRGHVAFSSVRILKWLDRFFKKNKKKGK
jgi:hypothetical protein